MHGRVPDLAKVVQRRYNLALAVVYGNYMDAVIVDTERTAQECITMLKQACSQSPLLPHCFIRSAARCSSCFVHALRLSA